MKKEKKIFKKIFIGSTKPETYDRRLLPIIIEIELEEKSGTENFQTVDLTPITPPALVLHVSGNVGNQTGGQIDGELKRLMETAAIEYRPGWNPDRLTQLLEVWERWHLNDSKPGCRHQNESKASGKMLFIVTPKVNVWKMKDEAGRRRAKRLIELLEMGKVTFQSDLYPIDFLILDVYTAARNGEVYKPKTPGEQSYFDHGIIEIKTEGKTAGWVFPKEHPEGVLNKPCPECGYKYGSAWLFEPLPQEVIDFVKALDQSTAEDLEDAEKGDVRGFVRDHKIRISLHKVEENPNAADWKDANHFQIRLWYKGNFMRTHFSQGKGIAHNPTAADVLNALLQDARTLEDYPDPLEWAESLGFGAGAKTAKIFKATQKNTEALKKLMGDEYQALLETETL